MKKITILRNSFCLFLLLSWTLSSAQTPGAIVAEGGQSTPSVTPLNPDGDGFITSTGTGFSAGQEASEFELPWLPIVLGIPEPVADVSGAACGQAEIVSSVPINNAYAGYFFMDDGGTPGNAADDLIFFRMRIAKESTGNFGYSFLFDTDLTIGNIAPNNDPNFVAGNPGFEREVTVSGSSSSGNVTVLNVDGNTGGNAATIVNTYPKTSHWQRSYPRYNDATCTNPATFVDFYVPLDDVGLTMNSNFRVIFATANSGASALSGSAADIGGINNDICGTDDECFTEVVNEFPIADIAVSKTLVTPPTYIVGQTLEYSITVNNAGPDIATFVDITDTPTNLTITSVTGGGCTSLPCTIPSIGIGGSVVLTVQATTNATGPFDNVVTVATSTPERNLTNNTDDTGNGGTVIVPTFVQVIDGPWENPNNWNDLRVPTVNDDAAIDVNVQSIVSQDQAVNSLVLRQGTTELTSVDIADTFTVNVKEGLENNGEFFGDGEVLLDGPTSQVMSGSGDYENLRINNLNGVLVDNTVLSDPTEINGVLYADSGTFTTSDNVLFPCTFVELGTPGSGDFANGRAGQIGPIGAGATISGDVRVEQCYPGRRAYRYVSASTTTTSSIQDNWQENATAFDNIPVASTTQEDGIPFGFGTHITGVVPDPAQNAVGQQNLDQTNGLDWQPSGNASMFEFNEATQDFDPVLDTEGNVLESGKAYTIIIRGSREVDLTSNASPTSNTKLRSTGTAVKGPYSLTPTVSADQYILVGNPFHAIVDMNAVFNSNTGFGRFMTVFDPTLGGAPDSNPTSSLEPGRGAFVSIDMQDISPGNENTLGQMRHFLQAYQGVFMLATVNNPTLTISETHKAVDQEQVDVFSTTTTDRVTITLYDQQSYAANNTADDRLVIKFGQNKNSGIDYNDALKFFNPDENLGRLEGSSLLSIEDREMPQIGEVLELFTTNYRTADYVFVVKVDGLLDNTVTLYDNYTGTETVLNNDASTAVNFSIDPSNPVSEATDRFELRFATSTLGATEFDLQGISVYPNPASDILNINLGDNTDRFENLELFDINGRLIATKDLTNNVLDTQMDVNGLSSGVYVLKVNSGTEQFSTKVIIE